MHRNRWRSAPLLNYEERCRVREAARTYEQALSSDQRKRLGQFFSGVRLGKLLAHLSLQESTRTIIDPMAGHGDLLDATFEAATECAWPVRRLDGIEIDGATAAICRERLEQVTPKAGPLHSRIVSGDAFSPRSMASLKLFAYDLVIANPPYVRYQALNVSSEAGDRPRRGVLELADEHLSGIDGDIWRVLVEGYSGLADLSVPAWLLAGMIVKPGGYLALVAPATWRSRNYADVVRYLLLRCFAVEFVVEDKQPGWFSDALVRTHLIVARRLAPGESAVPLCKRSERRTAHWLQIAPEAADSHSLVGAAFPGKYSDRDFAKWARSNIATSKLGISVRTFSLNEEWRSLRAQIEHRRWFRQLELTAEEFQLQTEPSTSSPMTVPDVIKELLPSDFSTNSLVSLEQSGIQVGQGLRTGCNQFFYVTVCGPELNGLTRVKASSHFNEIEIDVPSSALSPVLRRQSELANFEREPVVPGRVLDLRQWVLPEDSSAVAQSKLAYKTSSRTLPKAMPDELAKFVAMAACTPLPDGKLIPQLSAVRTNVRSAKHDKEVPRFWYMLPDFAPRHLPTAFVPRVISGLPWVEVNCDPPILIDANFSTFWSASGKWSGYAMKALLNSAWCRSLMEAIGTPLGGGALKLEATHLRRLPIPVLSNDAKKELDVAGRNLTRDSARVQDQIDRIILNELFSGYSSVSCVHLAKAMTERAQSLSTARRRAA
jgi:hypothetical protein